MHRTLTPPEFSGLSRKSAAMGHALGEEEEQVALQCVQSAGELMFVPKGWGPQLCSCVHVNVAMAHSACVSACPSHDTLASKRTDAPSSLT